MPTPLCDALRSYLGKDPARFHMPGHKGLAMPLPELSAVAPLDVTELPDTGNLLEAGAPFDVAQKLWADLCRFEVCQFLTGGSTLGVLAGLSLLCSPGDRILVDRGCHRSVFAAMAILDLEPVYLPRPWIGEEGMAGPIRPEDVREALEAAGRGQRPIRAVCVTSPAYTGILSDVEGIGKAAHESGARLFVDGAHGAHLPFLGVSDPFQGADAVVVSAHKTLPALGQAALLFANGFSADEVRRMTTLYSTSSPSYPIMASIDAARQYALDNRERYRLADLRVTGLRLKYPSLPERFVVDPLRLTLCSPDGHGLKRALESRGIYPEMADAGHVVFICTPADLAENFDRLEAALDSVPELLGSPCPVPAPPLPEVAVRPRQAVYGPCERGILRECGGRISAQPIAPYPPGVPVIAPGERISEKSLAYLRRVGYNLETEVSVLRIGAV